MWPKVQSLNPRLRRGKAMILYPRAFAGLPLLFTCIGSAIPRAVVPGLIATAEALLLEFLIPHVYLVNAISSPAPFSAFSSLVAFLLGE